MSEKSVNIPDYTHSSLQGKIIKYSRSFRIVRHIFMIIGILVILAVVYVIWPGKIHTLPAADAQKLAAMITPNFGDPDKMIFLMYRSEWGECEIVIYCEYPVAVKHGQSDPLKAEECQDWTKHIIRIFNSSSANNIPFDIPDNTALGSTANASYLTGACAISGNRAWYVFQWKKAVSNPFDFLEKYPAEYRKLMIKPPEDDIYRADYEIPH